MSDIQNGGEFLDGTMPPVTQRPPGQTPPVAPPTLLARVLDGRHVWGTVEVWPAQHGVMRYRLVVFPPGIDTVERRLLRAWRGWSTWGAVAWLMTLIGLSVSITPGMAFAASAVAYLVCGGVLYTRVVELRSRVRSLTVLRIAGYADEHTVWVFGEMKSLVAALCQADAMRDHGESSPTDHEATWWQVYDRLGQLDPGPVGR
jgi:hypothetical protein